MKLRMKQDWVSIGDDFTITDQDGNEVVTVDGKVFSIGDKLTLHDPSGRELARISEKLISIGPAYEVIRGGKVAAVVKKDLFTLFRCSFTVDVPGPDDLEAEGSLTEHEYEFRRGGRTVAKVSKSWFSFRDSYGIEVAPGEDTILILASAVVIDLCCHRDREGHE
ncbi:MAG: LURP-one-related family protein [Deltaproteobacteria bacterium]|nr:LURP-one-related family protein [Deltaproteobacteria bacterium]